MGTKIPTISKAILLFVLLISSSCEREVDQFDPTTYHGPGDIEEVFELIRRPTSDFVINHDSDQGIVLAHAMLSIPAQSFQTLDGDVVHGDIQIRIRELRHQRDLVREDISTLNDAGDLLALHHAIWIQASQGTQPLIVDPDGEGLTLWVPDDAPLAGQSYHRMTGPSHAWNAGTSQIKSGQIEIDIPGMQLDTTGYEYQMTNTRDWSAIMRETPASSQGELCLLLLDSNTPANTTAYMLFDDFNGVQEIDISSTLQCLWTELPSHEDGRIIVLGHKGGQLYEIASTPYQMVQGKVEMSLFPIGVTAEEEVIEFVDNL